MSRVYLDHNATTPLRNEARDAMISAMGVVGNPSSVHAEGRRAKGLVEDARAVLAEAFGSGTADVIFVSGATEAAALALAGRGLHACGMEHAAVAAWITPDLAVMDGAVQVDDPARSVVQLANAETGIVQDLPAGLAVSDITQVLGGCRFPMPGPGWKWYSCRRISLADPRELVPWLFRKVMILQPKSRVAGKRWGAGRALRMLLGSLDSRLPERQHRLIWRMGSGIGLRKLEIF